MILLHSIQESQSIFSIIQEWDTDLFLKINSEWIGAFGDFLLPILRFPKTWIPLYAGLFIFMAIKLKWKSWPWVLMAIVCITVTDQISSQWLKGTFDRLRPCQNPDLVGIARLLVNRCPGNASFPSSHAVNHFGIGTYFFFTLRPYFKRYAYLFFLWAASICYAQVYVGVHYPIDVIGGTFIGLFLGGLVYYIYWKFFKKWTL